MIIGYFCFLEIGPMTLIIYILQKTSQKKSEDVLPSVFNTFIREGHKSTEAASNIVTKLLTRSSFFSDHDSNKSRNLTLNINIQDEEALIHQERTSLDA